MTENEQTETVEKKVEQSNVIKAGEVSGVEGDVYLRKFDTEDLMRLRDEGLDTVIDTKTGNEKITMKLGSMMKWNVILGVKSASFFKSTITEERGAQPVINERLKEFRQIPATAIDALFQKIKDYNVVQIDDSYAKK